MSPEQKQYSLWESLKVVVSVDLCAILKGHLAEHLWAHRSCVRGVNPCPHRLPPISQLLIPKGSLQP